MEKDRLEDMIILNDMNLDQCGENQSEREVISGFLKRMQYEGFRIVPFSGTQSEKGFFGETEAVIMTNSPAHMEALKKWGLPCIFYDSRGTCTDIYGADMIVESLDEVDRAFLTSIYNRHYRIPAVIMETKRLVLRETTPEDTDCLYEMYADPLIARFLPELSENPEEERNILASYFDYMYGFYGYGLWSVIEKESGCMVGRVGFENGEIMGESTAQLGYFIGGKWRRRGYAFEAAEAALEYAQNRLGFRFVYIKANRENMASCALAEKCGFNLIKDGSERYYKKILV